MEPFLLSVELPIEPPLHFKFELLLGAIGVWKGVQGALGYDWAMGG